MINKENFIDRFFPKGKLSIVAARPATGLTSFAISTARSLVNSGEELLYRSLEMPESTFLDRVLTQEKHEKLMNGKMFHISDDLNAWSFDTLKHRMEENNCKTLIVDYLQLLNLDPEEKYDSRRSGLRYKMEQLSQYARWYQCRIIVLSMLSRLSMEKTMHPDMEVFSQLWGTCPEDYNYYSMVSANSPDTEDRKSVAFVSVSSNKPNLEIGLSMDKKSGVFYVDSMSNA